jgi:DNA-binding response OmpR family regulator/signal transduction histidine kinase
MKDLHILIVEDSQLILNSLKNSFIQKGAVVQTASTLKEANAHISKNSFDFVLLDLMLPDGDGKTLIQKLNRSQSKVIVMTTQRESLERDALFGSGIVDYIVKERRFDELWDAIESTITSVQENRGLKILIGEDSSFMRNTLKHILSVRGFEISTAIDGKEVLDRLSQEHFDALILDLHMPTLSGLEVVKRLKRRGQTRSLPIMVLTGVENQTTIAKVIKHNVKDLLRKPFIFEEMLLKVDTMMHEIKQKNQLQKQESLRVQYEELIESSTYFLHLDTMLSVKGANSSFEELLGVDYKEKKLSEHLQEFSLEKLRKILSQIKAKKRVKETLHFKDKGTPVYIAGLFSGLFSPSDELEEILFIGHDVTLAKINERELQERIDMQTAINSKQQETLANQSRMVAMGELVGNIAHQWRQPLNALGLYIQDTEDAFEMGDMDEDYISFFVKNSMEQIQRMSDTIDDFRLFFKTDMKEEQFTLYKTVQNAIKKVESDIHSIGAKVELSCDKAIELKTFKYELEQIFMHILINAKDAIAEKSDLCEDGLISIKCVQENDWVKITFQDNGVGMSQEVASRVFEPYFTTKEQGSGTGVGLYMSKMTIEKSMGGKIENIVCERGAILELTLPVYKEREDAKA